MSGRLAGKTVLVTGAAGGIGAAVSRGFAKEGARVVAADLDGAAVRRVAADLDPAGSSVMGVELDVTAETSCREIVRAIETSHGAVDIVVNNAGIYPRQAIEEISYDDWRRVIGVSLDGAFLVTRCVVPAMKARRWGRIINISSSTVWQGTPGFAHYVAAKAGIIGFTRSLASELGSFGITVNAVSPGLTVTETVRKTFTSAMLEARRETRPLKRHEQPEHLVGTIVFLATDEAEFITGQTINVDGGAAMH